MLLPYNLRGAVWILVYLLFILAPLFALLAGSHPPARDFWTEFSVALGYAGLAMMGLQFGLTARFRYVTEPWGEDVIYHFHRQISLIAVALVVAHPIILFIVRAGIARAAQLLEAPMARPLRRPVDYLADRAGGDGPVAREAGTSGTRPGTSRHIVLALVAVAAGAVAHGGMELLPRRSLEAGAVDRPDDLLDRAAALRAHRQAAVHAPPAVPRRGSAPGTRRHLRRW